MNLSDLNETRSRRVQMVLVSLSRRTIKPELPTFGDKLGYFEYTDIEGPWGNGSDIFHVYFQDEYEGGLSPTSWGKHLYKSAKMAPSAIEAATLLVEGIGAVHPATRPSNSEWLEGLESPMQNSPDVIFCLSFAAVQFLKARDFKKALIWANGARDVFENLLDEIADGPGPRQLDWKSSDYCKRFWVAGSTAFQTLASTLRHVGNTAASMAYIYRSVQLSAEMPDPKTFKESSALFKCLYIEYQTLMKCRHPEPTIISKLTVIDSSVNLYGSWKKVHLEKPGGLTARMGSSVFVYGGHLYVLGGVKDFDGGPSYKNFWHLDLTKQDKWQRLPDFPLTPLGLDKVGENPIIAVGNKAYLFTGANYLPYFDLETKQWSGFMTTFKPDEVVTSWPYSDWVVSNCAFVHLKGRLYVFGGVQPARVAGCDLFLELNLETREWRRLSGTPFPKPMSSKYPGPRIAPLGWVNKIETKIFIAFGQADRSSAQQLQQPEGSCLAHQYDDIWSWDIENEQWKREKMLGNMPGPRTEVAGLYSYILDKVVLFGGRSSTTPCWSGKHNLAFSYFADTFICDLGDEYAREHCPHIPDVETEGMRWRQVLTRGFPTYRAGGSLVEDPVSGKIFLFSGSVQVEFLPFDVKGITKSFADIWELRIDLPGGNFDAVDIEDEARTAKAGPWQRCFSCGSVGSWKKCGGYLYVLGGEKSARLGPFYFDFWRVNLQKLDKWQLPPCPLPRSTHSISNQNVAVWKDTAYYFTGSQILYCFESTFDLQKGRWSKVAITLQSDDILKRAWPYSLPGFKEFSMNCVNGRLYIFGGCGRGYDLVQGSNLFMELNIATRRLKRLSGTPVFSNANLDSPGPRVSAIGWVTSEQTKIFIAYGHTNRMAANLLEDQRGANYPYDDIWSWDIKGNFWNQEKIQGNSPGPRSEMAAVYSLKLNKLVTFGGYNPTAPYKTGTSITRFSYLADTFVGDINTQPVLGGVRSPTEPETEGTNWRQVFTRGFPTYRARASVVEDPVTSKIYLFSGYLEQEFLPAVEVKNSAKCFADIWELRLDLPGGNFEGVDVEEETRTAKVGPWQRCFACGSVGSWKKCNGICNGQAFFCDRECMKDGWKEHKVMHGCRKVT